MITLEEKDFLRILRSAMFRDSWLEITPLIREKLSPEAQEQVRRWEKDAP